MEDVNIEKAKTMSNYALIIIFFSILTYFIPIIMGEFDFGIIVEIIAFVFLIISRLMIEERSKKLARCFNVFAAIPIIFLITYDVIKLLTSMTYHFYITELFIYIAAEILPILYLRFLFSININLKEIEK
mgnify:CR=1 FL=1